MNIHLFGCISLMTASLVLHLLLLLESLLLLHHSLSSGGIFFLQSVSALRLFASFAVCRINHFFEFVFLPSSFFVAMHLKCLTVFFFFRRAYTSYVAFSHVVTYLHGMLSRRFCRYMFSTLTIFFLSFLYIFLCIFLILASFTFSAICVVVFLLCFALAFVLTLRTCTLYLYIALFYTIARFLYNNFTNIATKITINTIKHNKMISV